MKERRKAERKWRKLKREVGRKRRGEGRREEEDLLLDVTILLSFQGVVHLLSFQGVEILLPGSGQREGLTGEWGGQ